MNFSVTNDAAKWYKKELNLKDGDSVKIFTKIYGGIPTVYPSFFLGIGPGEEINANNQVDVEGIKVYIEPVDDWIVKDHNLQIDLKDDEAVYNFTE